MGAARPNVPISLCACMLLLVVCVKGSIADNGDHRSRAEEVDRATENDGDVRDVDPDAARKHFARSENYRLYGETEKQVRELEIAIRLDPDFAQALNNLAWVLATAEQPKLRNGQRALELATKACRLTFWKISATLDTLAAAYARIGDFAKAVEWQEKVLEDRQRQLWFSGREGPEKRLKLYRSKQAWPPD